MKNILARFLCISALAIPLAMKAGDNDWMAGISDNQLISQFTIPGSHESGSYVFMGTLFANYGAVCQHQDVSGQLSQGCRYLDIRLFSDGSGTLTIEHGIAGSTTDFETILDQVYSFLNNNPSETVIMVIKEEQSATGSQFADFISQYIQRNINYWYWGNSIPSLGSVRGKIVLINRYGQETYQVGSGNITGINGWGWQDNALFQSQLLYVQDKYTDLDGTKENDINQMRGIAWGGSRGLLYINYTSASWSSGPSAGNDSQTIDPWLLMSFAGLGGGSNPAAWGQGIYGVVVLDDDSVHFQQLCEVLYNMNFNRPFPVGGSYAFYNENSGKCLDDTASSTSDSTICQQWDDLGHQSERWNLVYTGDNSYAIINSYSHKCLDDLGLSTSDGTFIGQYDWYNHDNQKWQFYRQPDGTYAIQNVYSGKELEIGAWSTANGAQTDQYYWANQTNQKWWVKLNGTTQ